MPIAFTPKGEDAFGFSSNLSKHLQSAPPSAHSSTLSSSTSDKTYLSSLSYDPLRSKYYNLFAADPKEQNAQPGQSMERHKYRQYSFQLNAEEEALFKKNGFVVSERMGTNSFAELYYRIYTDDLPVFVTGDSILHAWHKSFDTILEQLEANALRFTLATILEGMGAQIGEVYQKTKDTVLKECVLDADFFICVGLSLLKDTLVEGCLGQKDRIQKALDCVVAEQTTSLEFFGRSRDFDFSLFKPRGHYTTSKELQLYFKCMTWCGTVDLRVAGPRAEVSTRELGAACVLYFALHAAKGLFQMWSSFDEFLQKFIGVTDSMTFDQLGAVLKAAQVSSLGEITEEAHLVALQEQIIKMDVGNQNICNNIQYSPLAKDVQMVLPRSFTFMGQKFTLDGWVTSNVTYDRILDQDGNKVQRRIPSALDVAYTVFNNDHVAAELDQMMKDNNGMRFRDGLPYQQNLIALRKVIDNVPEALWKSSIYFQWLATLRALSVPTKEISSQSADIASSIAAASPSVAPPPSTTEEKTQENPSSGGILDTIKSLFNSQSQKPRVGASSGACDVVSKGAVPQVALTSAWQDRVLNTQLSSWTQLRHDTILYVKQSFTCGTCCEYPDGYVEPNVAFWQQFLTMAKFTASLMKNITLPAVKFETEPYPGYKRTHSSTEILASAARFYSSSWVPALETLVSISEKQAGNKKLAQDETDFLKTVMEESHGSGGTRYEGWYPTLFFGAREDSGRWDPLIADVHTDVADGDVGDPGCILHEAVGNVHTMLVTVDRGDSVVCYAGPVQSHYEFTCPVDTRKNDREWRDMLRSSKQPPHPRWTRSFLVPGENTDTSKYRHKDDQR